MKVQQLETVGLLINSLTKDEDLRQELWVHYLDTNSVDSLSNHLQKLSLESKEIENFKANAWYLMNKYHSQQLSDIIETFTEFEKSVVCLVMLGFDINKIAKIKGISEVRIRQTMLNIRYNPSWRIYHNAEDEVHRR